MPDIYAVWYRSNGSSHDIVVGFGHGWNMSERLAKDLYSIKKKIDKLENVVVGVTLMECGTLYSQRLFKKRWQVLPVLSVLDA